MQEIILSHLEPYFYFVYIFKHPQQLTSAISIFIINIKLISGEVLFNI